MSIIPDSVNKGHMEDSSAESMYVEASANVNVTRFSMPKDPRELIFASLLALSILVNIVFGMSLYGAYKDMRTQEWLKNDALDKFISGPYADTKSHVLALELNCKREK